MQIELSKFPFEQRREIGNRIKGARIMSGLTQEEFAAKYSVSLSTLKNVEIARVTPRFSTILSIISAIREEGIVVDDNWIIYGKSNKRDCAPPSVLKIDDRIVREIDVLKHHFIKNGVVPIIATVKNNDMAPKYLEGDVLIGLLKNIDFLSPFSGQFLVEMEGEFTPYTVMTEGKTHFAINLVANRLIRIKNERIASIVWHRQYQYG